MFTFDVWFSVDTACQEVPNFNAVFEEIMVLGWGQVFVDFPPFFFFYSPFSHFEKTKRSLCPQINWEGFYGMQLAIVPIVDGLLVAKMFRRVYFFNGLSG